jgi:CxxC motif-containing protein (DUF1111 family)
LATALALAARGDAANGGASAVLPMAALTAGATTVMDASRDAFSYPARNLRDAHRAAFFVGNSFFNENWVAAPASVATRDGLGPLFNVRSCSGCHFKDGRGRPPEDGEPLRSMLLRISVPGTGPHGAPRPHAVYGDQIQGMAIPGVPAEADVLVSYEPVAGAFADGTRWELRRPRYRLERLAYGPVGGRLMTSPRVAPAMIGLGLLEAVPEAALLALADPDDRDGDGVSGRVNLVWDARRRTTAVGRFGWKAEQPTVLQQTAGAFAGDMGITSTLSPAENHTSGERACAGQASGGTPEIDDELLAKVALYARTLGVPARRGWEDPGVRRGEALFARAGCAACHVPDLVTGPVADLPELGGQAIHAYTDLLLHDLGAELADGRPAFVAHGREWRTPPLWGLGLVPVVNGHALYLHDGRARGLGEAVLWHGGEAAAARAAFVSMSVDERRDLLSFVGSL